MWLCQAEVLHTSHVCKRFLSWHIFDPLIKVEPPSLCHLLQCALAEKNQTCRYCIWKSHLTTYKSGAHTWRFSSNGVSRACMQPYQLSDPSDIMMMIDDGTAKIIVTMISCPSVCARLIWWFICWGAFRTKTCIMYMGDPTAIKGDWQGLQQASSPALCRTNCNWLLFHLVEQGSTWQSQCWVAVGKGDEGW